MKQPELFAIYHATKCSSTAATNLTKAEVMHNIYTDYGDRYWLEPRMLTSDVYNDEPSGSGDPLQAGDGDYLEWDVWFKDNNRRAEKSGFTAHGETEEAAREEFLKTSWDISAFNTDKWIITPMAEFNAERAIDEATEKAAKLIDGRRLPTETTDKLIDELYELADIVTNGDSVKNQDAALAAIDQFLQENGLK
jgi:hypothetical protein